MSRELIEQVSGSIFYLIDKDLANKSFWKNYLDSLAVDSAKAGVDALADFIKEFGLPTKMGELRLKAEITPEILRNVADTCNLIKCGPREHDRDEVYDILRECM